MRKALIVLLFPLTVFAGQADFTWDEVSSAIGYRIYEKPIACAETHEPWLLESGDLPVGVLTYSRTGLVEDKVYCWYVTAFNPLAESVPSNEVEKTFPLPAPANFREQ